MFFRNKGIWIYLTEINKWTKAVLLKLWPIPGTHRSIIRSVCSEK